MSEIKVTQADQEVELRLIREIISMYHTTRLSGVSAEEHIWSKRTVKAAFAAHRQAAMIEGARMMQELAARDVETWFPGSTIEKEKHAAGKSLRDSILALDPASVVEKNHD